jgi:hypothetical protein
MDLALKAIAYLLAASTGLIKATPWMVQPELLALQNIVLM